MIAVLHPVRQSGRTWRSLIRAFGVFSARFALFFNRMAVGRHSDDTLGVRDSRAFRKVQAALQTAYPPQPVAKCWLEVGTGSATIPRS